MRRVWKLSTAIAAISLAVAACGGSDSDGADATSGSSSAATSGADGTSSSAGGSAPDADAGASGPSEAAGDIDPDAVFRMAYAVGPTRWDAHRATSSYDNVSLFLTYDRLVHLDANANPVPGLATDWEFNEDGTVLTLTIREGVTFHDGEPLNAEAVKANIERGQTVDQSAVAAELAVIESVDVVDDYTVQLNLNGPGASLPLVLSDRAGIMISPAAFDNPDLDQQPVGAGMFIVTDYQPGNSITYEAYPDYWDPEAVNVAGIDYLIQVDSTTRLNAIRSDQVDWTYVDPTDYDAAENAGLTIIQATSLAFYHLHLNRSVPPLDNKQVREALNYAIDRQAIIDGLLSGQGKAAVQAFPEGYLGYNEEIGNDYYTYDPDKARELLAEAGFPEFDLELLITTGDYAPPIAEVIQDQLAQVGVTVTLRSVPGDQLTDVFFIELDADGAFIPWGGRSDPSQTLYLLYGDGGFANPGGHTTPTVMADIAETLKVGTAEERASAVQQAIADITEEALDVILYYPVTPVVTNGRVANYETFMSGKVEFRGVAITTG